MPDDLVNRLRARFGAAGLRTVDPAGTAVPDAAAALLGGAVVPRQVGPYFHSGDEDPVTLGDHYRAAGAEVPDDGRAAWCRIGWDRGMQLCVDEDGAVRADFAGQGAPAVTVGATLDGFLESLVALDEALSLIAAARSVPESADHVRVLLKRLANIDHASVQGPDTWWSAVIQDIRHTASHPSFASFAVLDDNGAERVVTDSGSLCLHPEERIWQDLRAAGTGADLVRAVHTELEPCFLPGHYCSLWMAVEFPRAEYTHNFPYGDDAESREQGFLELLRHAASSRS